MAPDNPRPIPPAFRDAIIAMFGSESRNCPSDPARIAQWANEHVWLFSVITIHQAHDWLETHNFFGAPAWRTPDLTQDEYARNNPVEVDHLSALLNFVGVRDGEPSAAGDPTKGERPLRASAGGAPRKRSTERGEGQDKLIAALTKHHKYAEGGCLNLEPIGCNQLAKAAKVSPSTASAFFKEKFHGHTKYKSCCGDSSTLVAVLKLLNGEYAPHILIDGQPPAEDGREDE